MVKFRYPIFLFFLIPFAFACTHSKPLMHRGSSLQQAASAEMGTGTALYNNGCYRQALPHFLKAHEQYSAMDQLDGVAMSLNNIGNIYRTLNNPESAILFFDEALQLYMAINDPSGAVQTLSNKSAALITAGRLDDAGEILSKAEKMAAEEKISLSSLMHNRSILLVKQKKYADAKLALKENLSKTGQNQYKARAAINFAMGNIMSETNKHEKAISHYLTALKLDRKTGFHKRIAEDLEAVGKSYMALNKTREAISYLKRSAKIYALMRDEKKVAEIMAQLDSATANTDINTTVIRAFINDWLSGNIEQPLCE